MPQLHAGAPAHSLLPADLRTGVGEIQRGKDARPCCLSLPPTSFPISLPPPQHYFIRRTLSEVSVPIALAHQSRCPAHLSSAATSRVHASGPLISDASLHLFHPDQSRVTHHRRPLGAMHPAAPPAALLPERRSYFSSTHFLISLWQCWNAPFKRSP